MNSDEFYGPFHHRTNPDQWPTMRPFYDIAKGGGEVRALVEWAYGEYGWTYAWGRVDAYEEFGGMFKGLRGVLDQRLRVFDEKASDWKFRPVELETFTSWYTSATVTDVSSRETRVLDDPCGGPNPEPGLVGWSTLHQNFPTAGLGSESLYIRLCNVWAWRHLQPPLSLGEIAAEIAGQK
jgi:hypothetical protein